MQNDVLQINKMLESFINILKDLNLLTSAQDGERLLRNNCGVIQKISFMLENYNTIEKCLKQRGVNFRVCFKYFNVFEDENTTLEILKNICKTK